MIVRPRLYETYMEAAREWRKFDVVPPVENEEGLLESRFFFVEGMSEDAAAGIAFQVEELGGWAGPCHSERTRRMLLVFEGGLLSPSACAIGKNALLELLVASSRNLRSIQPAMRMPRKRLSFSRTLLMGILNVTPDSFSDGGTYFEREAAVKRGVQMVDEGASMIDVGGESTRPYAQPVDVQEEARRVVPVIKELSSSVSVPISVDTRRAEVAEAALDAGADMINDVSGLADQRMRELAAERKVPLVIMHMLGDPTTMQEDPQYEDVVGDIGLMLQERIEAALAAGVKRNSIIVDPGIGFGKRVEHNLEILRRLREFRCLGQPLLVGASRKAFVKKVVLAEGERRLEGSLAAACAAVMNGANIIRVHDVRETERALRMIDAIRTA